MNSQLKLFLNAFLQVIHLLCLAVFLKFIIDGIFKKNHDLITSNVIQCIYWILMIIQHKIKNDLQFKNYDFFTHNKNKLGCYFLSGILFILDSFFTYIYLSLLFGNPEVAQKLQFITEKIPVINFWYYLLTSTYGFVTLGIFADILKKRCEINEENLLKANINITHYIQILRNRG